MNNDNNDILRQIHQLENNLMAKLDHIHLNLIDVMFKACSSANKDLLHNLNQQKEDEKNENKDESE